MGLRRVLTIALLITLATAAPAHADDGRVGGSPGNVRPVASEHIRMESETVQVVLYGGFAEYLVDFKFVNSGAAEKVRLGFPFALDDKTSGTPGIALGGFQAWQGDTPLKVTVTTGFDGPYESGWYEHEATFPNGVTFVRVRYVSRPSVSAGIADTEVTPPAYTGMYSATAWYPYVLHTGAGWQGTIGRAVIRYTYCSDTRGWAYGTAGWPEETPCTKPAGFSRTGQRFQWILEDFEPSLDAVTAQSPYDIALFYNQGFGAIQEPPRPDWIRPLAAGAAASSESPLLEWGDAKFGAQKAIDSDPVTAWLSAPTNADGRGQTLRVDLGETRTVREVRILPGYARLPEDFADHARPRRATLIFSDGTRVAITLADEPSVQRFPVNVSCSSATLRIDDVYPGTTFRNVGISEIEFGESAAPLFESYEAVIAAEGPTVNTDALAVANPWTPETTSTDDPADAPLPRPTESRLARPRGEGLIPGLLTTIVLLGVTAAFTSRRESDD
ncbi:MAG: hypothetical protein D9V44_07800 [Actinobacteria bacterium]|nr:MAG: hypothetical protein D9V44_07800 [Actinomycetota bacterium]